MQRGILVQRLYKTTMTFSSSPLIVITPVPFHVSTAELHQTLAPFSASEPKAVKATGLDVCRKLLVADHLPHCRPLVRRLVVGDALERNNCTDRMKKKTHRIWPVDLQTAGWASRMQFDPSVSSTLAHGEGKEIQIYHRVNNICRWRTPLPSRALYVPPYPEPYQSKEKKIQIKASKQGKTMPASKQ
jgi:hypothetical protein